MYPLHLINLTELQGLGRSDLFLRLEIIKKILIIVNINVTWRWGISALICCMIITSFVSYYLNSHCVCKLIDYAIIKQSGDLAGYLLESGLMAISVYAVGLVPFPNFWFQLPAQLLLGMSCYIALCRLFRLSDFMEIWDTGPSKLSSLCGKIPAH